MSKIDLVNKLQDINDKIEESHKQLIELIGVQKDLKSKILDKDYSEYDIKNSKIPPNINFIKWDGTLGISLGFGSLKPVCAGGFKYDYGGFPKVDIGFGHCYGLEEVDLEVASSTPILVFFAPKDLKMGTTISKLLETPSNYGVVTPESLVYLSSDGELRYFKPHHLLKFYKIVYKG